MNRYQTKMGDRRENAVPCCLCKRATLALDALCDACYQKEQAKDLHPSGSGAKVKP